MTLRRAGNPSPREMSTEQLGATTTSTDQRDAARKTLAAMTVRLMPEDDFAAQREQLREILDALGLFDPVEAPARKHPGFGR